MNNKTKKDDCLKFEKLMIRKLRNCLKNEDENFFKFHIKTCGKCKNKFDVLADISRDFKNLKSKILQKKEPIFTINEYRYYKENLSAYIDNELTVEDNYKMKKFIIKTDFAKRDLLKECNLKELIKSEVKRYKNRIAVLERIRNFIFFVKAHKKG